MCPVCFSSLAWLIAGGVSLLGATAGGVAIARGKTIAGRDVEGFKTENSRTPRSGREFWGLKINRAGVLTTKREGRVPHL